MASLLSSPRIEKSSLAVRMAQNACNKRKIASPIPMTRMDKKSQQLTFNLTYRTLKIDQPEVTTLEPQETYLGRVDYNLTLPKGWLRYNANYQIGSGQEQKVQYNYLQVDVGQGYYTWFDRNEDGVKQLDEFEISIFQDQADHIRVVTFTDEYIRTNQVQFSGRLLRITAFGRPIEQLARQKTPAVVQAHVARHDGGAR